jgi:hypothetical protein
MASTKSAAPPAITRAALFPSLLDAPLTNTGGARDVVPVMTLVVVGGEVVTTVTDVGRVGVIVVT